MKKYVIQLFTNKTRGQNFVYRLTRKYDGGILYESQDIDRVMLYCWHVGICKAKVDILPKE